MRLSGRALPGLALFSFGCGGDDAGAALRRPEAGVTAGGGSGDSGTNTSGTSGASGTGGSAGAGGATGTGSSGGSSDSGGPRRMPTFRKIVLTKTFYAEGAAYGDFDRNGTTDVMSGPYWYEGPLFTTKHPVYAATAFDPHGYSNNFLEFAWDFDADGYLDVLVVNYPGRDAAVYVNSKQPDVPWARHSVFPTVDGESPAFTDLTGDGKPELVFGSGGVLGWGEPNWAMPFQAWTFHPALAPGSTYPPFTHGLGVGDIDRDGRLDLLDRTGGWFQPASLVGDPPWRQMFANFGTGGAQMFAYDVDADGDNDVITSLAAHDYGIAWFEQGRNAAGRVWTQHLIAPSDPSDAGGGVLIHQPHALALQDVDGDGLSDVVTGERFWGHVPAGTPDVNAPATLYWFSLERTPAGATYTPHLVDDASGVGTQVVAADVNDDGLVDILTGNKKGAFVFLQE